MVLIFWDCVQFVFSLESVGFRHIARPLSFQEKMMNPKRLYVLILTLLLIGGVAWLLAPTTRTHVYAQHSGWGSPVPNQQMPFEIPVQPVPSTWLVSFTDLEQKQVKQVIIVNPEEKRIGVYEISLRDGSIQFCGMRELTADFRMKVHNGKDPLPQQIERQLEQGK